MVKFCATLLSLSLIMLLACSSDYQSEDSELDIQDKSLPVDIAIKLSTDVINSLDPRSDNGFDSYTNSEPPETQYHYKQSLNIYDASRQAHQLEIYFILVNQSPRVWEVRTRLDERILAPLDSNDDQDVFNDEQLQFDSTGELDLNASSNQGVIEYASTLLNNDGDPAPLQLKFDLGTTEAPGDFMLNSLWFSLEDSGFFVTSPAVQQDLSARDRDKLFTRVTGFRHIEDGQFINRYDEILLSFPINDDGNVTSTSLSSLVPLLVPFSIESTTENSAPAQLNSIEIADTGLVNASYANGLTLAQGKIALARLMNPQDLLATPGSTSLTNSTEIASQYWQPTIIGEAQTSFFKKIMPNSLQANNSNYPALPYSIIADPQTYLVTQPGNELSDFYLSQQTGYRTDNNGFVINRTWERLMMIPADEEGVINIPELTFDNTAPLHIPYTAGVPRATENIQMALNLPANAATRDPDLFDPHQPSSFSQSITLIAFDWLGESHEVTFYFFKTPSVENQWAFYLVSRDDTGDDLYLNVLSGNSGANGNLYSLINFAESGQMIDTSPAPLVYQVDFGNGAGLHTIQLYLDENQMTQIQDNFIVKQLSQNGFNIGRLTEVDIDQQGIINASFSNQISRAQGQLLLVKVFNPDCLIAVENSDSFKLSESCQTQFGLAGDMGFGSIEFSQFEE